MFKIIFAVNMQAITKRIDELDRQRACQVAQKADKSGTVAAVAAVGAGEDKKTLTTDSTRLLGEIVDYNEMAINFDAVGVLNHNEHLELHNFLLDPTHPLIRALSLEASHDQWKHICHGDMSLLGQPYHSDHGSHCEALPCQYPR